jgi:hypothetical protein
VRTVANGRVRPSARFWLILLSLNILAFVYPVQLLLSSDDDATRLFAVLVLMGSFLLVAVADAVSVVFAYWL